MSVTVPEDELSPVVFEIAHVAKDINETFPSRLTGKIYGPWNSCEIISIPKDVADFIRERRGVPEVIQTPEGPKTIEMPPIEPAPFLKPPDVERLWREEWLPLILQGGFKADPETTRRTFLTKIDPSVDLEANRRRIKVEAERFVSAFLKVPPTARGIGVPRGIGRVVSALVGEAGEEVVTRYPSEWQDYLRDNVLIEPEEYNLLTQREREQVLKSFVDYLRRRRLR